MGDEAGGNHVALAALKPLIATFSLKYL